MPLGPVCLTTGVIARDDAFVIGQNKPFSPIHCHPFVRFVLFVLFGHYGPVSRMWSINLKEGQIVDTSGTCLHDHHRGCIWEARPNKPFLLMHCRPFVRFVIVVLFGHCGRVSRKWSVD